MRIEIPKSLDKDDILKKLKNAQIVDDGDYILIPKVAKIGFYDQDGMVFIDTSEIDYIESFGDTIYVYCGGSPYVSILKLYEYLDESSYLI